MTADTAEATKQARALLSNLCLDTLPVPLDKIAKSRGISVQNMPLDDELSGMSFIKDGVAVIVINAGHHPNRQRFTLAHEIGHHVLHANYLQNNVHVDKAILRRNQKSSNGVDVKEIQANAFAAELLMPFSHMKKHMDFDINDEAAIADLAKTFKVSTAAMVFRIVNLSQMRR